MDTLLKIHTRQTLPSSWATMEGEGVTLRGLAHLHLGGRHAQGELKAAGSGKTAFFPNRSSCPLTVVPTVHISDLPLRVWAFPLLNCFILCDLLSCHHPNEEASYMRKGCPTSRVVEAGDLWRLLLALCPPPPTPRGLSEVPA